jgi:PAS domain S-box-containing protein
MATARRPNRRALPPRAGKPEPARLTPPPQTEFYEDWQRYFDLYNFAPVAYIRLDRNGVVEEINQAGIASLGVSPGALLGRPLIVFVAQDSRPDFLEHMRRCRAQETVVETDLTLTTRQGQVLAVRAYSKRFQSVKREVYWTVLIDLTEQHRLDAARREAEAERARAESEERLGRQANEATHRFLNVLSHELRTPLTPALFAASRLIEQDMPENVRRLGAVISRNIQSEARLIDDLLDVSRIERGVLGLTLSPCDVHAVIDNVVEACRPQAAAKSLLLVTALRATRHFVNGDPGRLRQVFANLLTNAIKFTDHGEIEVSTGNDDSGALRVSVRDTGIGIEEGGIDTLFRSFTQHRGQSSRGGLGLGLPICAGIIAAHNGRVWATSRGHGQGSTFEVELATVNGLPLKATAAPAAVSEPAGPGLRILVVEDDADTAAILQDLLGNDGHALDVVHSVKEARQRAGEPWDIVISDLGLPDGNGFDVARHFRRPGRGPRLIALSGYANEMDVLTSTDAGFERHLVKPIDLDKLRRALG